jgi:adenosylhomocysteinase
MSERSDGAAALAWVRERSPVLAGFGNANAGEGEPFASRTVGVSAPLTPHTGVFVETLRAAGARVLFCGEPGTDHPAVVAELDAREGIEGFAEPGDDEAAYRGARDALLEREPDFLFDDGCALVARAHEAHPDAIAGIEGACEQTTAGVGRLEAMEREGELAFPVYAVNDAPVKRRFDNVHGTAESTLEALLDVTDATLGGRTVVVAGYGHCGRGLARKLRALGARTVVTERDPRKALEAHADGHRVETMAGAAPEGEYFLTATGEPNTLRAEHVESMADGAVLAAVGTGEEIDTDALAAAAEGTTEPRAGVRRYELPDGRRLDLLAGGRPLNLAAPGAAGNPAEVMDLTFGAMFAGGADLLANGRAPGLYRLPEALDRRVAARKLDALGLRTEPGAGGRTGAGNRDYNA